MRLLCIVFYLFISVLPVQEPERVDSVFLSWNGVTLNSLRDICGKVNGVNNRSICENRISSLPGFWGIDGDSLNRSSVRWKFLKKIEMDSVFFNRNWTLIELMETGERVRLINYVVIYQKNSTTVLAYSYDHGDWSRINKKHVALKKSDFVPPRSGEFLATDSYPYDFVITNFTGYLVVESRYYLEHTVRRNSNIVKFVDGMN
ncbi:hypothetical protein J2T02_005703 [Chitinophaga terrae (ex Kim and Jung 2007)]|uniref:hypothetical protein n=1 Tax=Chitinophaga terrae (ex Kim and Jung 2007) TaxID=408074 RepID=UPI00278971D8|nr:hypothetical protein [Chitinophaga terrae (ex Kim and Jung 2007)]MDQ0110550.1 hypothetical protein [Chitinophaga terrae (ex Kim and Jung 2007)]